jgi:glucose-1-phosphate adenylyltransferase
MDLLGDNPVFDINDTTWRIHSRSPLASPHYIADNTKTVNSIIMSGCEVYGTVENSVLASGVVVKKGAVIKNSIVMADVVISENSVIDYSIIDENTIIGKNCVIGDSKSNKKGIAVIGRNLTISDGVSVKGGEIIENDLGVEG